MLSKRGINPLPGHGNTEKELPYVCCVLSVHSLTSPIVARKEIYYKLTTAILYFSICIESQLVCTVPTLI
jgi:hypothetical protein